MEFWLIAHRVDVQALDRLVCAGTLGGAPRPALQPNRLNGMLKGFMDLVFAHQGRYYVLDYKSNWLGAEPAAYRRDRLDEAMARESYLLQYLIYTVALHRYLRLRVPDYDYERHFGGVYYLFLRGMDPAQGPACGVFHDRPAPALVVALDDLMASGATV